MDRSYGGIIIFNHRPAKQFSIISSQITRGPSRRDADPRIRLHSDALHVAILASEIASTQRSWVCSLRPRRPRDALPRLPCTSGPLLDPVFSLVHTVDRPLAWRASWRFWGWEHLGYFTQQDHQPGIFHHSSARTHHCPVHITTCNIKLVRKELTDPRPRFTMSARPA